MNFYFKDPSQDIRYIEVINTYNLAYWIAVDASHYEENESNITAFDLNKLINQYKLAIDIYEHAKSISSLLTGDHKIAANALKDFVRMCLNEFNFYSEDRRKDSESQEINLLSQINEEKAFQDSYLHFMNSKHAEYLILKSYAQINEIAKDILLIDISTNSLENFERAKKIVTGFGLAKKTINYAIQNPASFDGMIDEFEIINASRTDSLSQKDFLNLCDKNIEYMKLWREYYSINEQIFKDIYIDNLNLEESEYKLIQHEALSYQSKINTYGIEISKLMLKFINRSVPEIEVFSIKLVSSPLSFIKTT